MMERSALNQLTIPSALIKIIHEERCGARYGNAKVKRGFSDCDICPRCKCNCESSLHALRDYRMVRCLWSRLVDRKHWSSFFNLNLSEWIELNLSKSLGSENEHNWSDTFAISCWLLWKQRNNIEFNNSMEKPIALVTRIYS
ncbi:putative ribonuclease H protein At1g65750 family [Senna tora]|uniref:Putative ribonuclease H protein At1g65750 family n=1 Tax=Senna tora TaxID=362788 RepID=A0A834WJ23_9FABA|nr:putative ribonuclease H protein At1g65750 family [Senna tora]